MDFLIKPYFLIAQLVVIVLFLLITKFKYQKKDHFLSRPIYTSILFTAAFVIAYFYNKEYQLFCHPVQWANYILLIYGVYFIGHWKIKAYINPIIDQIVLGTGLFIAFYVIMFSWFDYLIFMVLNSVLILLLRVIVKALNKRMDTDFFYAFYLVFVTICLPLFMFVYIIKQMNGYSTKKLLPLSIIPLILFIFSFTMMFKINDIQQKIDASNQSITTIKEIVKDNKTDAYLTELILGAHWKYHTRLCPYDGWRPPHHNPILGFYYFFNLDYFGRKMNLEDRKILYKAVFPKNKMIFDCKCAEKERLFE